MHLLQNMKKIMLLDRKPLQTRTATCRKQISKVLETLHIDFLDQFNTFTKSEQAILQKITRKLK